MQVANGIETVKFSAGDTIFNEGDTADGLYFVLDGKIEISRFQNGNKVVLAECGAESVFGEMALIDGKPRSATVKALQVTECLKGTSEKFNSLIEHIDYDVKHAMQQMVGFVRSINSAQKPSMSRNDIADLNAIKKKAEFLKKQISSNRVLLAKVKELNPFINSNFNSLLNLL